jgi:shikimate kinase
MGMMGSGKTTVGRALAERTGWRYADNDELVRLVSGREPDEIDAADGEDALHAAEGAALRHALAMPPPLIVGAAAWVILDRDSVERLRQQPWVVYLRGRPKTLLERIGAGHGRRDDATDLDWLRRRTDERDHLYRDLATLTIDIDEVRPEEVVDRIVEALAADPAAV